MQMMPRIFLINPHAWSNHFIHRIRIINIRMVMDADDRPQLWNLIIVIWASAFMTAMIMGIALIIQASVRGMM
jgi:hypothetical protein